MRVPLILALLALAIIIPDAHATTIKRCRAVDTCLAALSAGNHCPLLPVPPRSRSNATLPEDGFLLEQLRPGVHAYTDFAYRTLIILKGRRLTLLDFPDSAASIAPSGDYLLNTAIRQILDGVVPRRVDMVYSHRHTDHIGQAGTVKHYLDNAFPDARILVWATAGVKQFLEDRRLTRIPQPTNIVGESGKTLEIAPGLKLVLSIAGGHTFDDLATYIPPSHEGEGILHYVDVVTPGQPPFIDFGLSVDIFRARKAQRELLKLDWEILSGGHGRLGTKFDVRRNIRYTESVITAAGEAAAEVPPEVFARVARLSTDPNAVQFGNAVWRTFASINPIIDICVRKTIERWGCRLTGVDLLAPGHCKEAFLTTNIET